MYLSPARDVFSHSLQENTKLYEELAEAVEDGDIERLRNLLAGELPPDLFQRAEPVGERISSEALRRLLANAVRVCMPSYLLHRAKRIA